MKILIIILASYFLLKVFFKVINILTSDDSVKSESLNQLKIEPDSIIFEEKNLDLRVNNNDEKVKKILNSFMVEATIIDISVHLNNIPNIMEKYYFRVKFSIFIDHDSNYQFSQNYNYPDLIYFICGVKTPIRENLLRWVVTEDSPKETLEYSLKSEFLGKKIDLKLSLNSDYSLSSSDENYFGVKTVYIYQANEYEHFKHPDYYNYPTSRKSNDIYDLDSLYDHSDY